MFLNNFKNENFSPNTLILSYSRWVPITCILFLNFARFVLRFASALQCTACSSNQKQYKTKTSLARLHMFSRALHQIHVFTSSFDWFTGLPVSFGTGHSDNFLCLFVLFESLKVARNSFQHLYCDGSLKPLLIT